MVAYIGLADDHRGDCKQVCIERIEFGLQKIKSNCESRIQRKEIIDRRVGKLLGQNTRGAGLFSVTVEEEIVVEEKEKKKANKKTRAKISWTRNEHWAKWSKNEFGRRTAMSIKLAEGNHNDQRGSPNTNRYRHPTNLCYPSDRSSDHTSIKTKVIAPRTSQ